MSERRRYVFRGDIRTLVEKNSSGESRYEERYIMFGTLRYYATRVDGSGFELDIESEPSDVNYRFPALEEAGITDLTGADDDDASEAMEVEGDDEEQRRAPRANTAPRHKRSCALYVQDRGLLPLPHVGMNLQVTLERRAPLHDQGELTHRDYVYEVVFVRRWRARMTPSAMILKGACTDAMEIMHADRFAYHRSKTQTAAPFRATFAVPRIIDKRDLYNTASSAVTALLARLASERWRLMRVGTLCTWNQKDVGSKEFAALMVHAFGNVYALAQNTLHTLLPHDTTAATAAADLNLTARQLCATSAAELAPLHALATTGPAHIGVFYGARDTVPLHAVGQARSAVESWVGVRWLSKAHSSALTMRMRRYVRTEIPDALDDTMHPCSVFILAYQLHCQQQRAASFNDDDMFDATMLLASINRTRQWQAEKAGGDAPDPVSGALYHAALRLLMHVGAWCFVPLHTQHRMLVLHHWRRAHDSAQWFATQRRLAFVNRIVALARSARPTLVRTERTGVAVDMVANTLYVYCAVRPAIREAGDDVHGACMVPLYELLDRWTYDDNDERFAVELLAFERIVLCDVHMLDRATLARALSVVASAKSIDGALAVELHGDDMLHSPFAELVGAKCFRTITADVYDEGDALRRACNRLSQQNDGVIDRRALATTLLQLNTSTAELLFADINQRPVRWLLLCARTEMRQAYEYLAHAAHTLKVDWADDTARQFAALALTPHRGDDMVLFASPYVGYLRRCEHVNAFYVLVQPETRGDDLQRNMFRQIDVRINKLPQAVSLDAPHLYIELSQKYFTVDHRVCCHTWAPNVLHVARHRADLCTQSFAHARNTLPMVPGGTVAILFGTDYCFDDVYRLLSVCCAQQFVAVNCDAGALARSLDKRCAVPHSLLGDLMIE